MDIDEASSCNSIATGSNLNAEAIKLKIANGVFNVGKMNGTSKVWQIFKKILDDNGVIVADFVFCQTCSNIYKYSKKSTSNLLKHKCYIAFATKNVEENMVKVEISAELKKEVLDIITEWVITDCRPYKIVEDHGLLKLLEHFVSIGVIHGRYVNVENALPHPTTVSRNIENLYIKCLEDTKTELQSVKRNGFGLTTDLWTESFLRKSYLALTIHYVKDGTLSNKLIGLLCMNDEKNTSVNIYSKVANALNEFNLTLDDKVIIVTDRGSNMVAAFRSHCHIYCINHMLHNVLQKSIEQCYDVADLCNSCTKIVKYFKKSGRNSSLKTTLKSFSATRCNTIYYVLVSIQKNWVDICQILQQQNETEKINNIQLHHLNSILDILEPFEDASKKLEGEKYATIHLVYMFIHNLKKVCHVETTDSVLVQQFKERLSDNIETTILANLTLIHKVALFLFAPANKLLLFSEADKASTKDEYKRLMADFIEDIASDEIQNLPTFSPENSALYLDFVQVRQIPSSDNQILIEIRRYESTTVDFHDDFNILRWWENHRNEFPLLYKLSSRVLATPASSASSERIFSVARNIITEKRCKISYNESAINSIMFLHSNMNEK